MGNVSQKYAMVGILSNNTQPNWVQLAIVISI